MSTARQGLANRIDLARASERRAAETKEAARANALKDGLTYRGLLPSQDAEAVAERSAQWNSSLRPNNPWELWLVERIAVESLRVDRCAREEAALRDRQARRAESCWDDDRRADAARLAATFSRDPASARSALESTRHGCDWLIAQCASLIAVLDAGSAWDEGQSGRARDLLGAATDGQATAEAVRSELDRLTLKLDRALIPLDAADRALAESGMGPDPSGEIRRVRRYETSCLRRLEWAWSQLKKGRRDAPDPDPSPGRPPASRFEEDDPAPDSEDDPHLEPAPADWGPIAESPPPWAFPAGAAPATGGPSRGALSLAGAFRDQVRGSKPARNRRRRRAAR